MTRRLFGMLAAIALTGALSGMLSGTPALAETVSLKLNHNLPDISITGKSFEFLAKRVSELTNGDVTMRVFHNGQLGQQRESIELVQQGALDMAKSNAAVRQAAQETFDFQYDTGAAEDTLGVTFHDVDKSGFIAATAPMIDEAKAASPEAAALIDQIIALGQ